MKYFFDTYAIIEIIKQNMNYEEYKSEDIIMSILNLGELYYALLKDFDPIVADYWAGKLKPVSLSIDHDVIIKAMKFRFNNKAKKFSFIDCVGYILAKELGLVFLTGDEQFKGFPNVEFVK